MKIATIGRSYVFPPGYSGEPEQPPSFLFTDYSSNTGRLPNACERTATAATSVGAAAHSSGLYSQ